MKRSECGGGKWACAAALAGLLLGGGTAQADQVDMVCLGSPDAPRGAGSRFLEQLAVDVDHAAREAYAELPFDELRVADAQQALGNDPAVIFRWVRDETRWLPYAGVLRGPDGVMLDRMGSSLDRALLLAAMLEEAGHDVRLATAALAEEGRAALQAAWSHLPVATRPGSELDAAEEREAIVEAARRHALDPDVLEALYREQNDEVEQIRTRLLEQTRAQHAALQEAARVENDEPSGATPVGDGVTNHWWVEWRSADGWNILDPALPEHAPGDRLVWDEEVEHHYPEVLPDEVYHRLRVQVVAEQLADGRLHEHVALDHAVPAAALLGRQLQLEMYPLGLPSQQSLLDDRDALAALPAQLLEQRQWMPYLRIGNSVERQKNIHADGSVEDPAAGTLTGAAFSEAASALGGLSVRGRRADEERPDPELTAVFVRFSVEAPGRETDTFERPMMDLLGPGGRDAAVDTLQVTEAMREQRAAALLGTFELLAQTTWLPPSQQAAWRYEALLNNRRAALGAAYAATHADFSFMGDSLETRSLRRRELDELAGLRLAFSPHLEDVALTRINLLGYVSLVEYRDGTLQRRAGFDIIDNRVDVPSGESARSIRLAQGVLDTLLEAELLGGELASGSNAATAYGRDLQGRNPWHTVDDAAALDELDWRPDADLLAHFEQTLAEGKALVMPVALPDEAVPTWWQLDPATGDVLGYGPDRRGQFVEAILTLMSAADNAMGAVQMVQTIWDCLLTSEDPHCCTRTAAANELIGEMAGKGLAAAAHAQRVNLVIGRSIVHGSTFRMLNEAAVGQIAGGVGEDIADALTQGMGCS